MIIASVLSIIYLMVLCFYDFNPRFNHLLTLTRSSCCKDNELNMKDVTEIEIMLCRHAGE
jgi:hypothetical protein